MLQDAIEKQDPEKREASSDEEYIHIMSRLRLDSILNENDDDPVNIGDILMNKSILWLL
jgi:hypothetical protein